LVLIGPANVQSDTHRTAAALALHQQAAF